MSTNGFPLHQYIKSGIDRIWSYWPEGNKAKLRQFRGTGRVDKGPWECEICKELVVKVHKDHIECVVDPKVGFIGWDVYINRKFVSADKIQILCVPCHASKTKEEAKIRAKQRKEKKQNVE